MNSAKAALARAKATLLSGGPTVKRYKDLLDIEGISRQDYETAQATDAQAKADVATAIYNYFDSKDAIIMAFVAMRMEGVTTRLVHMESQDDPLDSIYDDIAAVVEQHFDPGFWGMSLEIYAEASRNPTIAAALQAADAEAREQLWRLVRRGREKRGLAFDDATIDGRTAAMISLYNGLALRALHQPGVQRDSMVEGFRVAVKALLMS